MSKFPVKWYDSDFPGIPKMSGVPGAFIAALDACLVNGFGEASIDTIVVQDEIAKVTLTNDYHYKEASVVELFNLVDVSLNDEYRVRKSGSGWFTVEMFTNDGNIDHNDGKVRVPSLGWTKPFSAINKAVYKPNVTDEGEWFLVVDDSYALSSGLYIAEGVDSVDSYSYKVPHDNSFFWAKSERSNTDVKKFSIYGDDLCFYYGSRAKVYGVDDIKNGGGFLYFVGKTEKYNSKNNDDLIILGSYSRDQPWYNTCFSLNNNLRDRGIRVFRINNINLEYTIDQFNNNTNLISTQNFNLLNHLNNSFIELYKLNNYYLNEMLTLPGIYRPLRDFASINDNNTLFSVKEYNSLKKNLLKLIYSNISSFERNVIIYLDIDGPWR